MLLLWFLRCQEFPSCLVQHHLFDLTGATLISFHLVASHERQPKPTSSAKALARFNFGATPFPLQHQAPSTYTYIYTSNTSTLSRFTKQLRTLVRGGARGETSLRLPTKNRRIRAPSVLCWGNDKQRTDVDVLYIINGVFY